MTFCGEHQGTLSRWTQLLLLLLSPRASGWPVSHECLGQNDTRLSHGDSAQSFFLSQSLLVMGQCKRLRTETKEIVTLVGLTWWCQERTLPLDHDAAKLVWTEPVGNCPLGQDSGELTFPVMLLLL